MSENPKENTIFGRKKKEISENNLNILHSEWIQRFVKVLRFCLKMLFIFRNNLQKKREMPWIQATIRPWRAQNSAGASSLCAPRALGANLYFQ